MYVLSVIYIPCTGGCPPVVSLSWIIDWIETSPETYTKRAVLNGIRWLNWQKWVPFTAIYKIIKYIYCILKFLRRTLHHFYICIYLEWIGLRQNHNLEWCTRIDRTTAEALLVHPVVGLHGVTHDGSFRRPNAEMKIDVITGTDGCPGLDVNDEPSMEYIYLQCKCVCWCNAIAM